MLKPVLKWVLIVVSLLAIGPLASSLLAHIQDADGGHAVSLLVNGNLSSGLAAAAALFGAALIVGYLGSHFLSLNTGMASAGLVLVWGRFNEGRLENFIRRTGDGRDLPTLAIEGGLVMLLTMALTWLLIRTAHRAQFPALATQTPAPSKPAPAQKHGLFLSGPIDEKPSPIIATALGTGILCTAAVVWLMAMTDKPGQTFAAALCAALAAGALSQVVAGSKDCKLTPLAPMLSMAIVAVVGPLVAVAMNNNHLIEAVYAGKVLPLARPISLDWPAAALLGIPVGLGWAGHMLDRRHQ